MKPTTTALGAWVRRHREERHLSQRALAKQSGVPQRTISDMESGPPTRRVDVEALGAVCEALGLPMSEAVAVAGVEQRVPAARRRGDLSPEMQEFVRRIQRLGLTREELAALARLAETFSKRGPGQPPER